MDDLRAVLDHFLAGIFDIASRTAIAGGVAHQFHLFASIDAERPLAVTQRSQALAPAQRRYRSQMMMPSFIHSFTRGAPLSG